jgi:hypothetical protein
MAMIKYETKHIRRRRFMKLYAEGEDAERK